MRTIAIIPARGGSKRIERKNIKPFAGVPVIAYSIRAAIESDCFEEVMVSTDDTEIAEVARQYGASVLMRSAENSDDFATTADVIREVIEEYRKMGREFDALACIYATAPFVTPSRLRSGYNLINNSGLPATSLHYPATAAFTCVEFSYPIQRCLVLSGDSKRICMRFPQYANSRSQDLQKTYHDAGQFYFSTVKAFEETGSLWGPQTAPIILPETEVQDLDTPVDWKLAEMKFEMLALPGRFTLEDCGEHSRCYTFVPYTELDAQTSELMRQGRNEPDVRSQMLNKEEIPSESHRLFVESLKTKRRTKQYYAIYGTENGTSGEQHLIGSLTLEDVGGDETPVARTLERGIWLFGKHRGKGHAKDLLEALYKYLAKEKGVGKIKTTVLTSNEASMALERSLGARLERVAGEISLWSRSI